MVAGGYQYESVEGRAERINITMPKRLLNKIVPTCAITQTMPTEVRFWRKLPACIAGRLISRFDGWRATAPYVDTDKTR